MSDLGDIYRAVRDESRRRRARHRENAPSILNNHGIEFLYKNCGAHLIIIDSHTRQSIADFWPGTGSWKMRDNYAGGRGIFGLITELELRART